MNENITQFYDSIETRNLPEELPDSEQESHTESIILYDSDEDFEQDDEEYALIADEIFEYEMLIPYIDCKHNHYYLGGYCIYNNILLFAKRIQLSTFYKYDHTEISAYLYYYSNIHFETNVNTNIVKLNILSDGTYIAIVKTFWIKIIQRTWKRIFKQRKLYVLCLKKAILSKLLTFQYTNRITQFPGLRGMMYQYNKKHDDTEIINL